MKYENLIGTIPVYEITKGMFENEKCVAVKDIYGKTHYTFVDDEIIDSNDKGRLEVILLRESKSGNSVHVQSRTEFFSQSVILIKKEEVIYLGEDDINLVTRKKRIKQSKQ